MYGFLLCRNAYCFVVLFQSEETQDKVYELTSDHAAAKASDINQSY